MNKILNRIDDFFNTQKESEQKLLLFLPIIIFGFISYYFIYPISDNILKTSINENKKLKTNISSITNNNLSLQRRNLVIKNILKQAAVKLKKLNHDKQQIDILVNQLRFLKFNLDKWGKIYNDIPSIAKKYHLTILKLDNILLLDDKNKELIQKNMNISIDVTGRFIDFIKFINYFESKKELIKVESILIQKDKMLLTISIYGAKL